MDEAFYHSEGMDFVCSETRVTGKSRKMLFDTYHPDLEPYKTRLLRRKIKQFREDNWFTWGRKHFISETPRIYVNAQTRVKEPFFIHPCKNYHQTVLAIFPKKPMDLQKAASYLNMVDWKELGFLRGKRYLFDQRTLENICLPEYDF